MTAFSLLLALFSFLSPTATSTNVGWIFSNSTDLDSPLLSLTPAPNDKIVAQLNNSIYLTNTLNYLPENIITLNSSGSAQVSSRPDEQSLLYL